MANSGWAVGKNLARLEEDKESVVKRKPVAKKATKKRPDKKITKGGL